MAQTVLYMPSLPMVMNDGIKPALNHMGNITKKVMPFFQTSRRLERAKPQVMDTNRFSNVITAVKPTELKNARTMAADERVLR